MTNPESGANSTPHTAGTADAQVLTFLRSEAPKAHSADDLAALTGLDASQVQSALEALRVSGQVTPEEVSGYGGSATLWTVSSREG